MTAITSPKIVSGQPDRSKTETNVVLADNPESLLTAIVRMARDPAVDVQKLGALLDMQERLENRQRETAFNEAFARLQPRLPRVKKNGTLEYPKDPKNPDGPKRKISTFLKFEDIDEAIRPLLKEEGFSQSWDTSARAGDGGGLIVIHILSHKAGHSKQTSMPIPLDTSGGKNNLQAYGSSLTYGKRYTMCAGLNIVAEGEDDDGVRGGTELITFDQIGKLADLIQETKADQDAFLRFMNVAALRDIRVDDYPKAINALMAKKRKMQDPKPAAVIDPKPSGGGAPAPSFAIAPVERGPGGRGFDWKATKNAMIARAKQIERPEDFDVLRQQSARTIDGLRNANRSLWQEWNMESGEIERQLRERLGEK